MGSFVEDLWSSIFTAGPTPTLLVATNATFAALQVLLFALLLLTYSVHFVVLSFLSGALWWSINWFAREVMEVQRAEEEKQPEKGRAEDSVSDIKRAPGRDNTESDTETECFSREKKSVPEAPASRTSSSTLLPGRRDDMRKRSSMGGDSSGYGSTDSEWEKVDGSNVSDRNA